MRTQQRGCLIGRVRSRLVRLDDDECDDRLARRLIGSTDHGRFGDHVMRHESRLDLLCREAVPRDVHHIVDATEKHDVAIGVDVCAITGEVLPLTIFRES